MRSIGHRENRGHREIIRSFFSIFSVFSLAVIFFLSSCSIPNLESPACGQARDAAKRFYSFHFGNDMRPTVENLKMREKFLTPEFVTRLSAYGESSMDPFTLTEEFPKTFRAAECKQNSPTNIDLNIQLFWRDETKTVQKEVVANMVKRGDAWLVEGVSQKADQ